MKKAHPGRILFVGSGPGDPALLTVRARDAIENAGTVFVDPDVPAGVIALIGAKVAPEPAAPVAPVALDTATDDTAPTGPVAVENDSIVDPEETGAVVRPALGDPTEVAKTLIAVAKGGDDVVRVVAGDPLTTDSVLTEVNAVARTSIGFEVIPGLPAAAAVPSYAGMPLGSGHTEADVRGEVDWAALAAAPGPLVLHATSGHLAETASALTEHGVAAQTPVAVTVNGTTCQQRTIEATLATLNDKGAGLQGPLIVTIGKVVTQRSRLSWWESRALYGWTVLVPRTKDQAGDMSDRLVVHGAMPMEVPTIGMRSEEHTSELQSQR